MKVLFPALSVVTFLLALFLLFRPAPEARPSGGDDTGGAPATSADLAALRSTVSQLQADLKARSAAVDSQIQSLGETLTATTEATQDTMGASSSSEAMTGDGGEMSSESVEAAPEVDPTADQIGMLEEKVAALSTALSDLESLEGRVDQKIESMPDLADLQAEINELRSFFADY